MAVALVVAPSVIVACSSDGSDGATGGSTTVDPVTDVSSGGSSVSGPDGTDTTTVEVPTTPTTEAVQGKVFTGTLGNEDGTGVELSFVRTDGAIRNLTIRGLEVSCYDTGAADDVPTEVVDIVLPEVAVAADGSVEHTDPSNPWQPALQGSFDAEGRFLGNLFLNREADGKVCGGDVPLDLAP